MVDKIKAALKGFRKWSVMMAILTIGVSFRLTDHISGEEMVNLIAPVAAAFMAANMVEYGAEIIKEKFKGKLDDLKQKLEELKNKMDGGKE